MGAGLFGGATLYRTKRRLMGWQSEMDEDKARTEGTEEDLFIAANPKGTATNYIKQQTMESKILNITGAGSFENEYGGLQPDGKKLLFSFIYNFEDGTEIKANHQTAQSPFIEGDVAYYEVKKDDPKWGKSGSVKKPDQGNYQQQTPPPQNPAYATPIQETPDSLLVPIPPEVVVKTNTAPPKSNGRNRSFALAYAKDVYIAQYQGGGLGQDDGNAIDLIEAMAESFNKWMDQ